MSPEKGKGPAGGSARTLEVQSEGNSTHFPGGDPTAQPLSHKALRVIQGEQQGAEFIAALRAERATADDLAVSLSALYGPQLQGFCRVLVKALEVRNAA